MSKKTEQDIITEEIDAHLIEQKTPMDLVHRGSSVDVETKGKLLGSYTQLNGKFHSSVTDDDISVHKGSYDTEDEALAAIRFHHRIGAAKITRHQNRVLPHAQAIKP
jgi:hypothetical protein